MYTPEGEPHQGQMRFAGSGGLYAVMREFSRGYSNGSVNLGSSGGTNPTCKILRFSSGVTELISRIHEEKALTDKILLIRYSRDDRAVIPPGLLPPTQAGGKTGFPKLGSMGKIGQTPPMVDFGTMNFITRYPALQGDFPAE